MFEIQSVTSGPVLAETADMERRARKRLAASHAPNTVRAYRADWADWLIWCARHGKQSLPSLPSDVAAYLSDMMDRTNPALSTLRRRVASIGMANRSAGHAWQKGHVEINTMLLAIKKETTRRPVQAGAIMGEDLRAMIASCAADTLTGLRDRALLLVGFAGALRRSEVAAMTFAHVSFSAEGLTIYHPRSKGDRDAQGARTSIGRTGTDLCPVAALETWLTVANIEAGPIFRRIFAHNQALGEAAIHTDTVREIFGRAVTRAGLEASAGERLSSHGLRAGCFTALKINGLDDYQAMEHGRLKSLSVHKGYVRRAQHARSDATAYLGL